MALVFSLCFGCLFVSLSISLCSQTEYGVCVFTHWSGASMYVYWHQYNYSFASIRNTMRPCKCAYASILAHIYFCHKHNFTIPLSLCLLCHSINYFYNSLAFTTFNSIHIIFYFFLSHSCLYFREVGQTFTFNIITFKHFYVFCNTLKYHRILYVD